MANTDTRQDTCNALDAAFDQIHNADAPPAERKPHAPAPAILIVERDELLRWALYETLREAGYRLLPVRDELRAKELLDHLPVPFAAAVIDEEAWSMTGTGDAWLRERWPGLPILVLADEALPALAEHVRQMGFADLMVKPFEIAELRTRVARLVRLGRRSGRAKDKSTDAAAA